MSADIRPLSFGELLDRSFALYRGNFLALALICLIPGLIPIPFTLFLRQPAGAVPTINSIWPLMARIYAFVIANSMVQFVAQAAVIFAVSEIYLGRTIGVGEAFRRVGKRWTSLFNLWISIMIRCIGCGLTIIGIFFIPSLLLSYSFALPVVLFEALPVGQALKRSRLLTKGQRGNIFLTFLLMLVISWALALAATTPFNVLQNSIVPKGQLPPVWLTVLAGIAGALASAVSAPPLMVAITLLYYNTRVRLEGFDLQLMLERLNEAA
jgi:hypothetical protein